MKKYSNEINDILNKYQEIVDSMDKKYYTHSYDVNESIEDRRKIMNKYTSDIESYSDRVKEKSEWYKEYAEKEDILNLYLAHIPHVVFSFFTLILLLFGDIITPIILLSVISIAFYIEYYFYKKDDNIRKRLDRFYDDVKKKYNKIKQMIPKFEIE